MLCGSLAFCSVLLRSVAFCCVLLRSAVCLAAFRGALWCPAAFCRVLLRSAAFCWVLLCPVAFRGALLCLPAFCSVFLRSATFCCFCCVLLRLAGLKKSMLIKKFKKKSNEQIVSPCWQFLVSGSPFAVLNSPNCKKHSNYMPLDAAELSNLLLLGGLSSSSLCLQAPGCWFSSKSSSWSSETYVARKISTN